MLERLMPIWEVLEKIDWRSIAPITIASFSLLIAAFSLFVTKLNYRLAKRQAASVNSQAIESTLLSARTKLSETAIHIGDSVSLIRVYEIEHRMVENLRKKAVITGLAISPKEKEVDSQPYTNAIDTARNLHNELSNELNAERVWTQDQASILLNKCEEARSLAALTASSLRTRNADVGRLRKDTEEQLEKRGSNERNT